MNIIIASLRQLAIESPILVVCLTGIILALVFWKRCPISCLFILIALIILLLITLINPFMIQYIIQSREESGASYTTMATQLAVVNIMSILFRTIAIGLLITSVFIRRRTPTAIDTRKNLSRAVNT